MGKLWVLGVFLLVMLATHNSFALYTPQDALKDAASEPLTYVGQFIMSSSESGKYPECVYKNSKVLVISSYCVKRNVPAARLIIFSNDQNQGYVRLYAEIESMAKDISRATRSEYVDFLFNSSVILANHPYDIDMSALKVHAWLNGEEGKYNSYCVTAQSQKDLPNSTACRNIDGDMNQWAKASFGFWKNSDPNFTQLLRILKGTTR